MDEFRRPPVNRLRRPEGTVPRPVAPRSLDVQPSIPQQEIKTTASTAEQVSSLQSVTAPAPQPIETGVAPLAGLPKKPRNKKRRVIFASVMGGLLIVGVSLFAWYSAQLAPVNSDDTTRQLIVIETGSTPGAIASTLGEAELIKNTDAFLFYTRISGVQNELKAGSYRLSPSESTPEIVAHLTKGAVDTFALTLYPGATLTDTTDKTPAAKLDVTSVLKRAGYTDAQIEAGLAADYSEYESTLFQGRPSTADLEGYVYGETYQFSSGASVEDILRTTFDEFWKVIEENDLVAKFSSQGLSLYEGITLASIIQKEAGSTPDDMAQISQVFQTRLAIGMPLGSDPTYQYAADKLGLPRDTNLDSPYNTRRVAGLPPGPIAAPGEKALVATVAPADGDFLYFLSGDDNVTYFARTLQEHEANIVNHCQQKCQIL